MEEWRSVPGHSNYVVSDHGRVRRMGSLKCLKPIPHRGYLVVKLGSPNAAYGIHRIVAWAWLGEQGARVVNHIDGNKENNTPANLEYTTNSGNVLHAHRTGLMRQARGEKCGATKLSDADFAAIQLESGSPRDVAQKYGVTANYVTMIRAGKAYRQRVKREAACDS